MPELEVNGTTIAYTDAGSRHDPAILFGHGLLFGGWVFDRQIAALSARYRCVAIDWRGQGTSPPSRGGYDLDVLAADAVGLIAALGIGPVHWVGHSMGGFVGQRVAARHGGLLRSLTLLDSSADAEDPVQVPAYLRLARLQRLIGIGPILPRVAPFMFGPAFLSRPENRPVIAEWRRRIGTCRRSATYRAVRAVTDRTAIDQEIGGIRTPTLIIVGADDGATPPSASRRIAAAIPGAALEVLRDCGHSSMLERPEAVTRLLQEFLVRAEHHA